MCACASVGVARALSLANPTCPLARLSQGSSPATACCRARLRGDDGGPAMLLDAASPRRRCPAMMHRPSRSRPPVDAPSPGQVCSRPTSVCLYVPVSITPPVGARPVRLPSRETGNPRVGDSLRPTGDVEACISTQDRAMGSVVGAPARRDWPRRAVHGAERAPAAGWDKNAERRARWPPGRRVVGLAPRGAPWRAHQGTANGPIGTNECRRCEGVVVGRIGRVMSPVPALWTRSRRRNTRTRQARSTQHAVASLAALSQPSPISAAVSPPCRASNDPLIFPAASGSSAFPRAASQVPRCKFHRHWRHRCRHTQCC